MADTQGPGGSHGERYTDDQGELREMERGVDSLGTPAAGAGPNATDAANNDLLLERLKGEPNRSARFVCVIAVARDGKTITMFRGEVEGVIVDAPRGSNGFGYDPLFYFPPFGCTFGEVESERKFAVSHRGQALRKMLEYLARHASE